MASSLSGLLAGGRVAGMSRVLFAAALLGLAGMALSGCYQYSNYPNIPTARGTLEDPNRPSTMMAIVASVQYVATRYPPAASIYDLDPTSAEAQSIAVTYPMVFSGPRGFRRAYYEDASRRIGPQVLPLTPEAIDSGLPIFHVTRVWMRGNVATIDVLRPMPELGKGPDGRTIYQPVTVRLEGGFSPWRVVHARIWNPGDEAEPPSFFLPEVDRTDQFEFTQAMDRGETVEGGGTTQAR